MAGFQIGTNTTTSMPSFPPYVEGPMKDFYGALSGTGMLGRANGWQGSVAPWNSNQQGAYDLAGGMLGQNKNWADTIAGSGQINPNDITALMDPYAKAVGDDTIKAIDESYRNADAEAAARAASGVAFGGANSALALQRAQMARGEAEAKSAAMNGVLSQAYGQGAQLAGQNANNSLSAAIGADNGQTNFAQRGQGALSGLLTTGNALQGQQQNIADLPYQDLVRYLGLLQGSPQGQTNSTPVTFDPLALLLGLGGLKF